MGSRYFTWLAASLFAWLSTGCSAPSRVSDKAKNSAITDDKVIADMRQQGLSKPTPFYLTEINSKAMRSFVTSWSNATNPQWVKYAGGFVVYFIRDGIRYKVYYTQEGDLKCVFRQYSAEYMTPEMRQLVESAFRGYTIFLVSDVTKRGKTRYEIKIEDESTFKEIKIEDGGMRVANEYVKSK